MKYKALIEIGGYKIGDEVPAAKAEVWIQMYKDSPVEKVDGEESSEEETPVEKEEEVSDKESSEDEEPTDSILEDYLGRNSKTVLKNVEEDKLSKDQLNQLLDLEKSDKKRKPIIKAIKKRLKG